jgi:hypothetical protein
MAMWQARPEECEWLSQQTIETHDRVDVFQNQFFHPTLFLFFCCALSFSGLKLTPSQNQPEGRSGCK